MFLRPFRLTDAEDVQKLAGHREIASTTYNVPHPYEDGIAEELISKHGEAFRQGKSVVYAMTLKDDGRLVAAISLFDVIKEHKGELGYWEGVTYWGMGARAPYINKIEWLKKHSPNTIKASLLVGFVSSLRNLPI